MKTIAEAVAPLREAAETAAVEKMTEHLEIAKRALEANGWDLEKVAPYPSSLNYSSRKDYMIKKARHDSFYYLTNEVTPRHRRAPGVGDIRTWNEERAANIIERAKKDAAFAYEAYVAKLVGKVGECVDAEMVYSSGVWSNSNLKVTKVDGKVEIWNTKTIINVSVLGKMFNQWPTRLMK